MMSAGDEGQAYGYSCGPFLEGFLRLGRFSCDGGGEGGSAFSEEAPPLARIEANEGQDQVRPNHGKVVPGVATCILSIESTHTVRKRHTVERRSQSCWGS